MKRILSVLLLAAMLVGMLSGLAYALQKNNATRHTECTALSDQANSYYADNGFTYEAYAALTPGNESCLQTVNSEMYKALSKLMSETMTGSVTYNELKSFWRYTDCENSGDVTLFYSDIAGGGYNREHVWPKSRASFLQKDGGADIHHLRPTNSNINSTRSNYTMGNVQEKYPNCDTAENGGHTVLWLNPGHSEDGKTLGLVEVNDNIKGDVARIFLYVYTRWQEPNLFENTPNPQQAPDDNQNNGMKVIESLETLLEWCEYDPVDAWEMKRNDVCEDIVGNRNVFIDYPEFAWLMFDRELPARMQTPSGIALKVDTCPHTSSKVVRDEPTCTAGGKATTVCDLCGKRLGKESLPAVAHSFVNGVCTMCGLTESGMLAQTFVLTDSVKTGDEVVIVCAAKNIAFSSQKLSQYGRNFYNAGVKVNPIDGKITEVPSEIVWTVGEKNGNYTFSYGGQNIGLGDNYSSTNLGEKHDVWTLETAKTAGTTYIKNIGRGIYLEWFEKNNYWSAYADKSDEALFAMNFYVRADAEDPADKPTDTPDETPGEEPEQPQEPEGPTQTPTEEPEEPTEEEEETIEYEGFDDVKKRDWFYDNVVFAVEQGLMKGVGNDKFNPNGDVTRGMLVTILYRNENEPDVEDLDNPFNDVKKRQWYTDAIIWAAENEIVNGMSKTTFEPDTAITREQIAAILYRYAKASGMDVEEYEDSDIKDYSDYRTVSSYAKTAVKWAVGAGIINGMDGKLAPTATATRAQLAAMLERYLDL